MHSTWHARRGLPQPDLPFWLVGLAVLVAVAFAVFIGCGYHALLFPLRG